jgi:transposase
MARYVVDAVLLEGRSAREVAKAHGISKTWIYELIARYRAGGYEALEPRSRRPRSCKHETPHEVVAEIVRLRRELAGQGHDAGAETIAYHLCQDLGDTPSLSTIWRVLRREGLVVPQRQKRPHSSLIRFEAELPNECWQADVTAWALEGGEIVEIIDIVDDHSRLQLGCDAYGRVKAADVVQSFQRAAQLHGLPHSLLTDNGAVFVGSSRKGKVLLEYELERLGVAFKNSRPYHPQTLGKVERPDAQALPLKATAGEDALRAPGAARRLSPLLQPHPPAPSAWAAYAITGLYSSRVKARPAGAGAETYFRVREDRVDETGKVSLRYDSRLYKIGLGRAHRGRAVKLLIADLEIRVIDSNGELLRELTLDPSRCYQPLGRRSSVHDIPTHMSGMS